MASGGAGAFMPLASGLVYRPSGPVSTSRKSHPRLNAPAPSVEKTTRDTLHTFGAQRFFEAQAIFPASFLAVQQRRAVHHIAIHNQIRDAADVPDVLRWIAIDHEDIGAAAGGDLAQLIPSKLK